MAIRSLSSSCFRITRFGTSTRLLFVAIVLLSGLNASSQPAKSPTKSGWRLTWSDEFNGRNGSPPDPTKWVFETGGSGWGNDELESYTSRSQNVRHEGGNLVIEARQEDFTGKDGVRRNYTSARIKTQGRFSQAYGRFEARIKLPEGRGLWPAFWMLGDNFPTAGWPACGEIDIMESIGSEPSIVHGTLHGPGYSGANPLTGTYTNPSGRLADGFHVYAVEWDPDAVRFYLDNKMYERRTPADLPAGKSWVFDHPFFIVLNVAVGGNMPGSPDAATKFPQKMVVDYVRVYSRMKGSRRGTSGHPNQD